MQAGEYTVCMPKTLKRILPIFSRVVVVLPNIALAAVFLITWIQPYRFGERFVNYLLILMIMEFINVHAAGFLGNVMISKLGRAVKILAITGLGAFYTIFVGAFSMVFHVWWPLVAFWGLILNRMISVFFIRTVDDDRKARLHASWAGGVLCYMAAVFITLIPFLPAFGITKDVISNMGLTGSGIWEEEPYRVVAAGFLYFIGAALISVFDHKIARLFKSEK